VRELLNICHLNQADARVVPLVPQGSPGGEDRLTVTDGSGKNTFDASVADLKTRPVTFKKSRAAGAEPILANDADGRLPAICHAMKVSGDEVLFFFFICMSQLNVSSRFIEAFFRSLLVTSDSTNCYYALRSNDSSINRAGISLL